jgi:hypothetical protein
VTAELVPEPEPQPPTEVMWLAPVRGVFIDARERYPRGHEVEGVALDPLPLEGGVEWRLSPSDAERELMERWFEFYRDGVAKVEATDFVHADTVLVGAPFPLNESMPPFVTSFVIAASLHVDSRVRSRMLLFDHSGGEWQPHSAASMEQFTRLQNWSPQRPVQPETREAITRTYVAVRRGVARGLEHPFFLALAGYRMAASSGFSEVTAILLCSALEAIAADDESGVVTRRLVPRYLDSTEPSEAEGRLADLYLLRHRFVHSTLIPRMGDAKVRAQALSEGYAVVKEILRNAIADDRLGDTAAQGVRNARQFLDGEG